MHRRAAVLGAVLLTLAAVFCVCAPAIMAPQPPWHDVEAQQAAWDRQLGVLLAIGAVFTVGGGLLLIYAFVAMRIAARARMASTGGNARMSQGDHGDTGR